MESITAWNNLNPLIYSSILFETFIYLLHKMQYFFVLSKNTVIIFYKIKLIIII